MVTKDGCVLVSFLPVMTFITPRELNIINKLPHIRSLLQVLDDMPLPEHKTKIVYADGREEWI